MRKTYADELAESELEQDVVLFSPSLKTYLTQNSNFNANPMNKKGRKGVTNIQQKDSLFF